MSHAATVLVMHDEPLRPSSCPSCGQKIDASNVRCPRCRVWLTPPPAPPRWKRHANIVAACALVLASLLGAILLQWFFAPLPAGVTVMDAPDADDEARQAAH